MMTAVTHRQTALDTLAALPAYIETAERVIPGAAQGHERKLLVASEMAGHEEQLALDARVASAKSAVIDAAVAYLKAMEIASAEAMALGIGAPMATMPSLAPQAQAPQSPTPIRGGRRVPSDTSAVTRGGH